MGVCAGAQVSYIFKIATLKIRPQFVSAWQGEGTVKQNTGIHKGRGREGG